MPVVDLSKRFRFEAAHRLPAVSEAHKCRPIHGHSYEVIITVRGEIDPKMGWFIDYNEMSTAVKPLVNALDHTLLNDIPGLENATAELLAVWFWERLDGKLPGLYEVEVKETESSSCRYRGDERR